MADKVTIGTVLFDQVRGVPTLRSSGTIRCEVKKRSDDGTNTGRKGNGARDKGV